MIANHLLLKKKMKKINISYPESSDAEKINELIVDVFMKCVAPEYSEEGVQFFLSFCKPEIVTEKIIENTPILIAKFDEKIIGIIWTRGKNHISRYFVDIAFQGKGTGRLLFNKLLDEIRLRYKEISEITVNSSPYAAKAYEKLGFIKTDEEKTGNGMRYLPMIYKFNTGFKN
jgi:ribosomal protein S18 acetylase RimI-like enzyme